MIKKILCVLAIGTLPFTANAATLGLDIQNGGGTFNTDPDSTNIMVGWEFTLSQSRTVSGLGWWDEGSDGLLESHLVGIWTTAGALLATATVDNGDASVASASSSGSWKVDFLPASVVLGAGSYVIAGLSTLSLFDPLRQDNADDTPALPVTTDSALAYVQGRWIRNAGFAFATGTADGTRYFGPTMTFAAIPLPATLPLFMLALGALAWMRRRPEAA